jgi:nucleoside-diphosphate-sugar epimerase
MQEVLGFRPRVEFADGIREYVAWLESVGTLDGAGALRR